jgi:hypothetical protein
LNQKAWETKMPDSDAYRKRAEECLEQAAKATDPDIKRRYEEMARGWLVLVGNEERQQQRFNGEGN